MTFGEQLTALRLERGLSQVAAAKLLNIPRQTLAGWEAGQRVPPEYTQRAVLEQYQTVSAVNQEGTKQ